MLWLLGGYMWLYVHRPFEYYPLLGDLQIERVYMVVMIAAWAMSPRKGLTTNRMHAAFAAFMLAFSMCWLVSPYRNETWDTVENYYKVMVFYILFVTTVNDQQSLRQAVWMYLGAVALYMGHSLLEFAHGRCEWRMGIRRMVGVDITYHDSNAFASTMLLSLPMTFPLWSQAKTMKQRLPLLAHCSLASLCILLTGSRTGFLGLLVFTIFCMMLSQYRARMLVLLGASLVVGVMLLPGELQNRFLTIIDPSVGPANAQESAEGRKVGLQHGFELFSRSPLLGVGPSGFAKASGLGFNPHNMYAQLMSELGLAGIVSFGVLLACFYLNWRETKQIYREHPEWSRDVPFHLTRAIGLNVIMLLFTGMAGHNLYRYSWAWYAAFNACAVHCMRTRAAEELAWPALGRLRRRPAPAGEAVLVPLLARPRFHT